MAFLCATCCKAFATQQGLAGHSRAKQHPYCHQCSRSFVTGGALGQHLQTSSAHNEKSAKPTPPTQPITRPDPVAPALAQLEALRLAVGALTLAAQTAASPVPAPVTRSRSTVALTNTASVHGELGNNLAHPSTTLTADLANNSLAHRGITYNRLTPAEQTALYPLLLAQCLSPTRLALQAFPLSPLGTPTPNHNPSHPKPLAVVLDCEMVGSAEGQLDQPITVSLIDFFTGETLINTLVQPTDHPVTQWRTNITGISAMKMRLAAASGEALPGRQAAVARLFEFVDDQTIIVGHSLWCDLRALGVVPVRVVDLGIMGALASGKCSDEERKIGKMFGLERLARELLGMKIRGEGGRGTHDSLEDVLATREVVVWCLRHPGQLAEWAGKNWGVPDPQKQKRGGWGKRRGATRGGRGNGGRANTSRMQGSLAGHRNGMEYDEGGLIGWREDQGYLRWEDVVDYDTWPKSPPDSD